MLKQAVRDRILQIGIVPVVRASSPGEARTAAECVCKGGIPIVEITMTVPGAIEVIRELAKHAASELLVGAGTVVDDAVGVGFGFNWLVLSLTRLLT